jgi:acetyl-CoA C-acetyltransferase
MQKVSVVGIGAVPVAEHWDLSLRELAGMAALEALEDAQVNQVDAIIIGNMMSGTANKQQHLGAYLADWIGMPMVEGIRIEAACSSGASAFRAGLMMIASGDLQSVLVIGAEKMTDVPSDEISTELATAADADWEADQGISFVGLNALIMQRYMHTYGWKKEDFANFSVNAHANGVHNPNARFQKAITKEAYLNAVMVAPPISIMDASPVGDGAAATLLVSEEIRDQISNKDPIYVIGSAAATDAIAVHDRKSPLWLAAAEKTAKEVYQQAGITPAEVDFFEAHDAFSIMATLSLEACGFAAPGQGVRMALEEQIFPAGKIPIATRGGLKARGHPVGATGMYQIIEAVEQLRGVAGKNQVRDAKIGLTQNIGGSGSNIITHLFSNEM